MGPKKKTHLGTKTSPQLNRAQISVDDRMGLPKSYSFEPPRTLGSNVERATAKINQAHSSVLCTEEEIG